MSLKHIPAAVLLLALTFAIRQAEAQELRLESNTFTDGSTLPASALFNYPVNGVNICSVNGAPGGDQSPELHWNVVPEGTRSFVVIAYDVTAAYTHWGMYNINASTHELPMNAGASGSPYGQQILNDGFVNQGYDGPCPPANVAPTTHEYVFTLYALSTTL